MECAECGKPYMAGLEFRYTEEGFFCITCYKESKEDKKKDD